MLETKWLYLLLNAATISVPLLRSFEPRVAYYKSFDSLFKAMAIWSGFFLVWDIWFTKMGVWGFTHTYLSGIEFFGLPLGEYLFFVTVPFACLFIYRVLIYFFPKGLIGPQTASKITFLLVPMSFALAALNYNKWYTGSTFLLLALALVYVAWIKKVTWMGQFYQSYAVALLPFFLKNGILTGTWIETQVVWYNNAENLGVRLGTIPFEDIFYGLLLILGTVYFYEGFEEKKRKRVGQSAA